MENASRPKQNIVFCVLTILSNLLALALIAGSPRLRRFSKFHITASITIANIAASLTYFPLDIHETLEVEGPSQNLAVRTLLRSVHIYCAPSINAISFVCLSVDYLVNRVYKTSLLRTIITSGVSIVVSWGFGLLSLIMISWTHLSFVENYKDIAAFKYVEIYNNTRSEVVEEDSHNCKFTEPTQVMVIIQVLLWGFLPLSLAFIVVVSSAVLRCVHTTAPNHSSTFNISSSIVTAYGYQEMVTEIKLVDTIASMVVSVVFSIPFLVEVLFSVRCTPDGRFLVPAPVSRNTELVHWSVAFILPVLWMLDSEFRKAITRTCDKACAGPSLDLTPSNVY